MSTDKVLLTDEYLYEHNFKRDDSNESIPENLRKFFYAPEDNSFRIMLEKGYDSDNNFGFNYASAWKADDEDNPNKITKRAAVHGCLLTQNDLLSLIVLCELEKWADWFTLVKRDVD